MSDHHERSLICDKASSTQKHQDPVASELSAGVHLENEKGKLATEDEHDGTETTLNEAISGKEPFLTDDRTEVTASANTSTIAPIFSSRYDEMRAELLQAKSQSFFKLALMVVKQLRECPDGVWIDVSVKELTWQQHITWVMVEILASTSRVVIDHLVEGDLPSANAQNGDLGHALNKNASQKHRPGVLIQYLVDETGRSPTVGELREILANMELDLGDKVNSSTQTSIIREWIAAVTKRFEGCSDDHIPDKPISEVSYVADPAASLRELDSGRLPNYLMNLTEATSKALFDSKSRGIKIDRFVIYHLHNYKHAGIAELLFSQLAQSYITDGDGFIYSSAGSHLDSAADNFTPCQYDSWKYEVKNSPEFRTTVRKEVELVKQSHAANTALVDEVSNSLFKTQLNTTDSSLP